MTSNLNTDPTLTGGLASASSAVLDSAHVGDIQGAFGTIRMDDDAPRARMSAKLRTLAAIVGPGLIVMVGDNDDARRSSPAVLVEIPHP